MIKGIPATPSEIGSPRKLEKKDPDQEIEMDQAGKFEENIFGKKCVNCVFGSADLLVSEIGRPGLVRWEGGMKATDFSGKVNRRRAFERVKRHRTSECGEIFPAFGVRPFVGHL
jgi:hypothetical protein